MGGMEAVRSAILGYPHARIFSTSLQHKLPEMDTYSLPVKLGILGGGQLARMLAMEAHALGFEVHVFSTSPQDPAGQVVGRHHQGDVASPSAVTTFARHMNLLTFESENVPLSSLDALRKLEACPSLVMAPAPHLMAMFSDRRQQKNTLAVAGLPTAPYCVLPPQLSASELGPYLQQAFQGRQQAFVLKACRGGYDGRGTYFFQVHGEGAKAAQAGGQTDLASFLEQYGTALIAEVEVKFARELATSVARSQEGEICFFPVVETKQRHHQCDWVKGPIAMEGRPWQVLQDNLRALLHELEYVGLITFELFETAQGALWINEVAPRVHNSAHYSMNALSVCQFQMHLRAIQGLALSAPKILAPGFAMANLVGTGAPVTCLQQKGEAFLHWYGKKENRPHRKMGHVNAVGESPEKALDRALAAREGMSL